jgi:kynurenine formamidase
MRKNIFVIFCFHIIFITSLYADTLSQAYSFNRVIDLTHAMYEGMPYWPGGVPFHMKRLVDYDQGYRLHSFSMGENTGTHVDAPAHFIRGERSIDLIPSEELIVPVCHIHISIQAAANPDYQLSRDDVLEWEHQNGPIRAGCLVVLNTGWYKKFSRPEQYVNLDDKKVMHFQGYSKTAAELLVERDVVGIGIDTLSIDPGNAREFSAHLVMLGAGKYQIENMANLDPLPATGAVAVVGVLPVRGGSQAQARILKSQTRLISLINRV